MVGFGMGVLIVLIAGVCITVGKALAEAGEYMSDLMG